MEPVKYFFSYSRKDSDFGLRLATDLKEAGANVWLDQIDILPGAHWDDSIETALNEATGSIVILSAASVKSQNVMDEVSYAISLGKRIVPLLMENCTVPFRLARLERIDFTGDYQVALQRLLKALNTDLMQPKKTMSAAETVVSTKATAARNQQEIIGSSTTSPVKNAIVLPEMIYMKGGNFMMGSNIVEIEEPVHEVEVGDFYIGKLLITFDNYDIYCEMSGIPKPDEKGWGRGKRPVINITWLDTITYCNWLSEQYGFEPAYKINPSQSPEILDTNGYRLPTEAEWEYAARGGRQTKGYLYAGSNNIDQVCWYAGNSEQNTHPVGEKNSNELGIHDMSGNVWEWCADINHNNYNGAPTNGKAWLISGEDKKRVVKGGYWGSLPIDCRLTARCDWREDEFDWDIGFRLARNKLK